MSQKVEIKAEQPPSIDAEYGLTLQRHPPSSMSDMSEAIESPQVVKVELNEKDKQPELGSMQSSIAGKESIFADLQALRRQDSLTE